MSDHHHRPVPSHGAIVLAVAGEAGGRAPDGLGVPAARPGRALADAVRAAADDDTLVVVVPCGFGLQPSLVADSARTLRDVRGTLGGGSDGAASGPAVALAGAFGDASHHVAYLRAAMRRHPSARAALVVGPAIDPFADAELFRRARLARQYGAPELVEVAFDGGTDPDPDLAAGLERCARLGAPEPVLVPAGFAPVPAGGVAGGRPGAGSPLLGPAALRGVLVARVEAARHAFAHGDDGIDPGVDAEDGHGYAHSHVAEDGTVYTHSH